MEDTKTYKMLNDVTKFFISCLNSLEQFLCFLETFCVCLNYYFFFLTSLAVYVRTAQQGLVASVRDRKWAQALLPLTQHSAQVTCVPQAANSHAVQVHRLHKVAQQRSLQAQNVPPKSKKNREKRIRLCEDRWEERQN